MSAPSQMITLPETILQEASRRADSLGVSTEQWIELTLAERIRMEQKTAEFFSARIARASGRSLSEILDGVGDNPPDPGDELE